MSRRGHYVPVSQTFNDDPETWELTDTFGDRAIRVWVEILRIMEETENHWRQVDGWPASLSRKVRQGPATVQRIAGWMLAKGWLEVEEAAANGSPAVLRARNYWKYHKRRETDKIPTSPQVVSPLPSSPIPPILPKPPNPPLQIPDWIPTEPWKRYLRHRKHKRAKVTPEAAEGLIAKLVELKKQGEDISAVLVQSVTNGWTGLFPVSGNGKGKPELLSSQVPGPDRYKPKPQERRADPAIQEGLKKLVKGLTEKMAAKAGG